MYFGDASSTTDLKLEPIDGKISPSTSYPLFSSSTSAPIKSYILHASSHSELVEWVKVFHRVQKDTKAQTPISRLEYAYNQAYEFQTLEDLASFLPASNIKLEKQDIAYQMQGPPIGQPNQSDAILSPSGNICGRTVSTYPKRDGIHRDGDPMADYFQIAVYPKYAIACVADGCGWGERMALAAKDACNGFVHHMQHAKMDSKNFNLKHLGKEILMGIDAANMNVLDKCKERDHDHPGTATFLGGLVVRETNGWLFVFGSIGDCKAFRWSCKKSRVFDLTAKKNQRLTNSASDPGGRLGSLPLPDVRNLFLSEAQCDEGDILFLVSDGVHDNVDASSGGLSPKEISRKYPEKWEDIAREEAHEILDKWRVGKLREIIMGKSDGKGDAILPSVLIERVLGHCINLTESSRAFLENPENRKLKLPHNYKLYPGKMDHTTCLAFVVGKQ
eukprot:TRINITY_DN4676_c0_g1_i1.p1 TRINITY_DN4676_c0_g1~~TRINITY_DN4676_c0_g1_i1.p1  ORF type:complete len:446 (+),score=120.48 TRINITY_DN4676_c0_g1_i1:111-1448(+)